MNHLRKHKLAVGAICCGIVLILAAYLWMWLDATFFNPIGVNFGPAWLILGGALSILAGAFTWFLSLLVDWVKSPNRYSAQEIFSLEARTMMILSGLLVVCALGIFLLFAVG